MEVSILALTAAQCEQIIENPLLIDEWFFLEGEEPPKTPFRYEDMNLGRSWHGIHYLINKDGDVDRSKPPGSYAVFGKHPIADERLGVVSCRYLLPGEVLELFQHVSLLNKKDLSANFNARLMNEMKIYPQGTWTDSMFDSLYEVFEELVNFYRIVSKKGKCTLNIFFY